MAGTLVTHIGLLDRSFLRLRLVVNCSVFVPGCTMMPMNSARQLYNIRRLWTSTGGLNAMCELQSYLHRSTNVKAVPLSLGSIESITYPAQGIPVTSSSQFVASCRLLSDVAVLHG